jgi:NADPH:quinone reductase-like Zn-dependent oxidoreductase
MKAVVMRETGGPDVLHYEDHADPEPGDGELLVRVRAVSVNPIDWKYRRGLYEKKLPAILGNDIAGVVEASRADGFSEGDEVFGFALGGGDAELARASGDGVVKRPDALTHAQAAAMPVAGLTAWQAVHDHGALESGQTALIAGAAGGVGHLAVQFAKLAGARTIGIGSARNRDFVLGLGADDYVDYTAQDVAEAVKDVDLAFDAVGGETTATLLPTVREGGALVTIANAPPEDAAHARGIRAALFSMSPNMEQLSRIGELVASGEVKIEIAEEIPLAEAARAHELSEAGHVRGKLVLTT